MNAHWFFVINPVSGKGKGLAIWRQAKELLDATKLDYSFAISEYHKHALQLVAEKYSAGCRHFIGIGGDGTLNEMLNAIFSADGFQPEEKVVLGLLPVGTGNDWVRSQSEKLTRQNLVEKLQNEKTLLHDVGVIEASSLPKKHFFLNVAGAGLDGSVVCEIEKLSEEGRKGQSVYLQGLLRAIFNYKPQLCKVEVENESAFEEPLFLLTASKGKFFGGGMNISPLAKANSGSLDFTIVKKAARWKIFPQLYKLFNGKIETVTFVEKRQSASCQISASFELPIQADGEWVGEAKSVRFSVLKNAVEVI